MPLQSVGNDPTNGGLGLLGNGYAAAPGTPASQTGISTASTDVRGPAVTIDLSNSARTTATRQLEAARLTIEDIPKSLDEIVERKTTEFTEKLLKAFGANKPEIRTDEDIVLHVDRFGNVTAEGPQKAKIEKFFRDNPDIAKEFKNIAGLNELKAAMSTLQLLVEEKKSARNEEETAAARDRFAVHSMYIHELSGHFLLKEGKLRSAAVDYADALWQARENKGLPGRTDFKA